MGINTSFQICKASELGIVLIDYFSYYNILAYELSMSLVENMSLAQYFTFTRISWTYHGHHVYYSSRLSSK